MTVPFNQIPSNIRVPFAYTEFDNSRASLGPLGFQYNVLMIGQKLAAGTAVAGEVVGCANEKDAIEFFGKGSMLHMMFKTFKAGNTTTKVEVLPLEDAGAGVASTATLTVTAGATSAGTIPLYIDDQKIDVGYLDNDTAAQIAQAIKDAIDTYLAGKQGLMIAAPAVADEVVTLTCAHKGEVGNSLDVRIGYYEDEKKLAGGVAVDIVNFANGSGDPDLELPLAGVPEKTYPIIISPYTSAANLAHLDAFCDERFGGLVQLDGVVLTSIKGTHGELTTKGESINSKFTSWIESHKSPASVAKWAAAYGALVSMKAEIDPAAPFAMNPIKGVSPAEDKDLFDLSERNLLLYAGVCSYGVNANGQAVLDFAITTYKENDLGDPDSSYLKVNTILSLNYIRKDWNAFQTNKYPGYKLKKDGTDVLPGQKIITPKLAKADAYEKAVDWETLGIIESADSFMEELIVEVNAQNPDRLDWIFVPDMINQFRISATQIQFLL